MLGTSVIEHKSWLDGFRAAVFWALRLVGSSVLLYLVMLAVPGGWDAFKGGFHLSSTGLLALLAYGPLLVGIEGTRYCIEARRQGVFGVSCLSWCATFLRSRPWAYLLPISVAGEAAMLLHGKRPSWSTYGAIRTLVSVRLLGLLLWALWCGATSGQAAISSLLNHLPSPIASGEFWLAMGGIGLCCFAVFERTRRRSFPIASIVLALASTVLMAATTKLAAVATGVSLGFLDILGFLALLNFAMVLPVSLGGIGVQEGILLIMNANAGIPAESLMSFSLLLHLQRLVLAAIGISLVFTQSMRHERHGPAA